MEKIKIRLATLFKRFKIDNLSRFFTTKEGGKDRVNFRAALIVGSSLLGPLCVFSVFLGGEDTSYVGRSTESFKSGDSVSPSTGGPEEPNGSIPYSKGTSVVGGEKPKSVPISRQPIKLAAKQVLVREGAEGFGFHAGSNLVGELQSTIDTRDAEQFVRVVLPFGGRRSGGSEFPKGTLLLGKASYPGKGEKVFVTFNQATLPDGRSIKLIAQALDPKDFSSGLTGEIQSQARSRTLSIMGLSVASAMGDVLTEKESLGQGYSVTPKANMKNAVLSGVSKAAEVEAGRLQEQTQAQDYVRVESGAAVIVAITQELSF